MVNILYINMPYIIIFSLDMQLTAKPEYVEAIQHSGANLKLSYREHNYDPVFNHWRFANILCLRMSGWIYSWISEPYYPPEDSLSCFLHELSLDVPHVFFALAPHKTTVAKIVTGCVGGSKVDLE